MLGRVREFLQSHPVDGRRICVGLSGGLDSVVLLHLLKELRDALGFSLSAVHVHHGLSPNAEIWADFCARRCAEWGVPLALARVRIAPGDPRGIEAAARAARYQAYARQDCDAIALAHHRDDQAETLVLQLLRGAGSKGLAAMPAERGLADGAIRLLRPLLESDRAELRAYAEAHGLSHIEDESNRQTRHARNYLRHEVLPVIERHFPAYRDTLSRAARHFADCDQVMQDMAALDAAEAMVDGCLRVPALAALSPPRARNLLRHFLALHAWPIPPVRWLEEALSQLLRARPDAAVRLALAGRELARYRDRVYVLEPLPALAEAEWAWHGEPVLALNGLGSLAFTEVRGEGLSAACLADAAVAVRAYPGAGRLRPDCRRPRRSVKNLLQESAVPPWRRQRLPALYRGRQLLWLAGIGVDCDCQAGADEPGWLIFWHPPGASAS
ncbi:MAG: tRNA lysidine(34) synthetase TilS [Betaproteobacteria bacterium]|nr:tRNA lysidine(34) synthetase TilS [Betaproteobacteria bacterium]